MNIPNFLTICRFLLIPIFVLVFNKGYQNSLIYAAIIFTIAGITDILDGYIARKYNMITKWGKILDPLADKAMQLTVLICLAYYLVIPMWVLYVILIKEFLMIIGGIVLYKDKIVVGANWYGKFATIIFYLAITAIIIFENMHNYLKYTLIAVSLFFSLFALVRYAINYKKLKKSGNKKGSIK